MFLALPEPYSVAFAVGALAGLRTGEVLGLDWRDVDPANRRIHVRPQVQDNRIGPLKDEESRVVPLAKTLARHGEIGVCRCVWFAEHVLSAILQMRFGEGKMVLVPPMHHGDMEKTRLVSPTHRISSSVRR